MDPHEASPLTRSSRDEAVPDASAPRRRRWGRAGLVVGAAVAGSAALYHSSGGGGVSQPHDVKAAFWSFYPGLSWVDSDASDADEEDGEPDDVPADGDVALSGTEPSADGSADDGVVDDDTVPDFWVYYSADDTELYAYDMESEDAAHLYLEGYDFTGDLKIDSPNKLMFWSDPVQSRIYKSDMTDGTVSVISSGRPVMGIAVDPSRGTLYYANQGDGEEHSSSLSGIDLIDYAGGNHSVVVDLQSLSLTPYGVEVDPAFILADFNNDDPGMILITCHDGTKGYIYQASLFGAHVEEVYSSSSMDVFGIVLDSDNSMMWWIENRGVANGLYNAMLGGTPESSFVAYLQESYWLAAVWDEDLVYASDYEAGEVYELHVDDSLAGELSKTEVLARTSKPRCLAFYYSK